jgi:hypothetical protein
MNRRSSLELLEKAARRYEMHAKSRGKKAGDQPRRVITISRMFGAGGISVSQLLSRRLDLPVWDREILDVLADESHGKYQAQMFESLDGKTQGVVDSFLTSVAGNVGKQTYFYLLQRAIYIISRNDAIILGRAAHLLLKNALKIFLKASMETRVKNVMQLLDVSEKRALKEIEKREQERESFLAEIGRKFVRKMTRPGELLQYDLEINTDSLDFEDAADVIIKAADARFGKIS